MPKRKRPPSRPTTLLDVARHADVSPMTASRVINHNPHVGAAMRERVLASAKALNYRPNLAGRQLRTSGMACIGVLYSNPSAAYLNQLVMGVLEECSLHHARVMVEKCAGLSSQRHAMQRLLDAGVDGVIVPPPLCDSAQAIGSLNDRNVSVVTVASGSPTKDAASIRIDDYKGASAMARYLLKLGHRHIGLVTGDPRHTPTALRTRGFHDSMRAAGIEVPEAHIVQGMFTYRSGLLAARRLLQLEDRPTAVFCSNDDMAAATIAVAHGMNLRVPGDVTVTGFDDTLMATTIWPTLTTIHQPVTAMGRAAVLLILEQIRRRHAGLPRVNHHQVMKYRLVKRESSAPPTRR